MATSAPATVKQNSENIIPEISFKTIEDEIKIKWYDKKCISREISISIILVLDLINPIIETSM